MDKGCHGGFPGPEGGGHNCALVPPSSCCMWNMAGEAGRTHFLLVGPRTPQPPSHPPSSHPGSSSSPGLSREEARPRPSLPPPLSPQKISSAVTTQRLHFCSPPNFSCRVLLGLTHMGVEAEPLIPSNPFFNPAPSLPPPRPGGGSHLEAWAPALLPPPPTSHPTRCLVLLSGPQQLLTPPCLLHPRRHGLSSCSCQRCFQRVPRSCPAFLKPAPPLSLLGIKSTTCHLRRNPGTGPAHPNITCLRPPPSKPGSLSPPSSPQSSLPQGVHRVGCSPFLSCSLAASPEGSHCLDST